MNKYVIFYIIGWILNIEAAFMLLPSICAIIYKEKSIFAFLITIVICLFIGIPLSLRKPKNRVFFAKEGFLIVALAWIVISIMGALPFYISGQIPSYVDALFEIISGFTTTGSSILTDIEAMDYCMLFWRSFAHWIGGMGVLVFLLAIFPMTDGESIHIMRAESPGPSVEKIVPKMRTTAILLYKIYLGMTLLQIVLLLLGGMPLFDALTITFGTAGTGGFAIKNTSIIPYTRYQQAVVTIFMFLFGVNFNIYYLILLRKFKESLKNEELKWYITIVTSAIILISLNIGGIKGFFKSIHHAAFQVSSIITTTGYATVDFNYWPTFSKVILVILMFIGACAGSTGGGIKVSRIVILLKSVRHEISYLTQKRSVKILRINGKKISNETARSVNLYFVAYMFIFTVSLLIISLDNHDFTTSFTAVASTLNNIGPGLEAIGPMGNFSNFSNLSKFVMMFDMLAGRLEIFPVLLPISLGISKIKGHKLTLPR
jgi:trk system potassium uptake protein TrkH